MMKPAQIVLPLLFAASVAVHAQDNPAKAAAATQAAAPAATTTSTPASPATNRRSRSSTATSKGANASGAVGGTNGSTVTGVPRYRAGFRAGGTATPAPTQTAEVSVAGGKGDDTAIDPGSSSLSIPGFQNALGVQSGTAIHVRLKQAVDSAHAKNGDMLDGVLAAPLGSAPAGAPVKLTVVAAAAAGTMTSAGELSVQVVSVNGQTLLSNVITAEGEQGKTLQADGAPARGTEASFTPDKPIQLPAA
jgi:hypothetical protein